MDAPKSNIILFAAMIGGSGVIAVSAMSVAVVLERAGQESVAGSSSMTIGATTLATTPTTVEATTMAVPVFRGPPLLPVEGQELATP